MKMIKVHDWGFSFALLVGDVDERNKQDKRGFLIILRHEIIFHHRLKSIRSSIHLISSLRFLFP
jgi:hypothetical protein